MQTTGNSTRFSNCSGHLGRTSLRPGSAAGSRTSRWPDCSGHLGRTSLRPSLWLHSSLGQAPLFRPSRPDFIETVLPFFFCDFSPLHCSGHLGRTSLRQKYWAKHQPIVQILFRPSRPDFIETITAMFVCCCKSVLFRPSRPDFIETWRAATGRRCRVRIVPAI